MLEDLKNALMKLWPFDQCMSFLLDEVKELMRKCFSYLIQRLCSCSLKVELGIGGFDELKVEFIEFLELVRYMSLQYRNDHFERKACRNCRYRAVI